MTFIKDALILIGFLAIAFMGTLAIACLVSSNARELFAHIGLSLITLSIV